MTGELSKGVHRQWICKQHRNRPFGQPHPHQLRCLPMPIPLPALDQYSSVPVLSKCLSKCFLNALIGFASFTFSSSSLQITTTFCVHNLHLRSHFNFALYTLNRCLLILDSPVQRKIWTIYPICVPRNVINHYEGTHRPFMFH